MIGIGPKDFENASCRNCQDPMLQPQKTDAINVVVTMDIEPIGELLQSQDFPSTDTVVVRLVQGLPENDTLHFYCKACMVALSGGE